MEGAVLCKANYIPLSPISFLDRSAVVYGDQISTVYDSVKYTWKETHERCRRLASALTQLGVSRGDVVAAIGPNTPALYELHYAAPMAGAIISAITTNCDAHLLSHLIRKSNAKIIFADYEYHDLANKALNLLEQPEQSSPLLLVPIFEPGQEETINSSYDSSYNPANLDYEKLLNSGDPQFESIWPEDECDPISISFTSGTTGTPKGVIHSHRAAYLNTLATIILMEMTSRPVFLWTVPMYHCNGWSFIWGLATLGGTNVCLRKVTAKIIFDCIVDHKVTHLAGALPILNMIVKTPADERKPLPHPVGVLIGGTPPAPQVLFGMEELGFRVTHAGGQTETHCCAIFCSLKPEWDELSPEDRARMKARQGLPHHLLAEADVKDPVSMESVPADGVTIGEVVYRGNNIMRGYLDDPYMTKQAFAGGWFHSGDMAVKHPDGYIELKDRAEDIVVCEGKVVGTIEIESMVYSHPAVFAAAVVGRPDGDLGKTLCAFVQLKDGCDATADEIIEFCRGRLPEDMVPKTVFFGDLPMTSTGKMQKGLVRERAKAMGNFPNGHVM